MIIKLNVPYEEKDEVKALGAKWDSRLKTWFIQNLDDKFSKWIDEDSVRIEKTDLSLSKTHFQGIIKYNSKNDLIIETPDGLEVDMEQLKKSLVKYEGFKITIKLEE